MILLCWSAFFRISYNMAKRESKDFSQIENISKEILRILEEKQTTQIP